MNYLEGKVAKVKYLNGISGDRGQTYDYEISDVEIEVGDTVIVSTKYGDALARIVKIVETEYKKGYNARILGVVTDSLESYKAIKVREKNQALDVILVQKLKEAQMRKEYALIAKEDSEFREVFEERYGKLED